MEKELVTHSSILAPTIPWTEDPDKLQSMGSQKVGYDLATKTNKQKKTEQFIHVHIHIGLP